MPHQTSSGQKLRRRYPRRWDLPVDVVCAVVGTGHSAPSCENKSHNQGVSGCGSCNASGQSVSSVCLEERGRCRGAFV
eukprot:1976326-Pyramimonas_sp.AAC.1